MHSVIVYVLKLGSFTFCSSSALAGPGSGHFLYAIDCWTFCHSNACSFIPWPVHGQPTFLPCGSQSVQYIVVCTGQAREDLHHCHLRTITWYLWPLALYAPKALTQDHGPSYVRYRRGWLKKKSGNINKKFETHATLLHICFEITEAKLNTSITNYYINFKW